MSYLVKLFGISNFMPHGYCFLWRPDLLVLHAGSDSLIAAAYFSIPAAIITLLRKRPDIEGRIAKLFIAFIALCGVTHLMSVVVLWYPAYALEGLIKLATAMVSVTTAIILWPLIPKIAALPTRTQLEQRNREIELLNEQLQRRLDSLSTLAGGVSHDFNNLLTVIKGHAQMLEGPDGGEPRQDNIDAIKDAADRAADVCRQMLAYSGRGHFTLSPTNLNEIVETARIPSSPDCDFKYSLSTTLVEIPGSREQLAQLVTDLCTNAIEAVRDAGHERGVVEVATRIQEFDQAMLDDAVLNQGLMPGTAVVLEVADNGMGMSPEVRDRLFEPYYSTKFTGRGLGMAAVQGIIRGHHGAIFIDTAPGEGTRIRVAFPVTRPNSIQYRKPMHPAPRKILVVDDEPGILQLAHDHLQQLDIDVITTSDPAEAVRLCRKHGSSLDAVIVDYLMPYTTGSDLLAEIDKVCEADAYLTSGYSLGEIEDPTLRRVLTGYIPKPFTLEDLKQMFKGA